MWPYSVHTATPKALRSLCCQILQCKLWSLQAAKGKTTENHRTSWFFDVFESIYEAMNTPRKTAIICFLGFVTVVRFA